MSSLGPIVSEQQEAVYSSLIGISACVFLHFEESIDFMTFVHF